LQPISGAINAGVPVSYTDPVTGEVVSRAANGAPDVSVFEYQGQGVVAPVVSPVVSAQNVPPTVSMTAPIASIAGATVIIEAAANDQDGAIAKVEFYNGAVKLGEDLTAPYSFSWTNVPAGAYALAVKAIDNAGAVTTSSVINGRALAAINQPPVVSLSASSSALVPGSVTLMAMAADVDGTIAKVDFYDSHNNLIVSDDAAPYSAVIRNITGTFSFTAKATDNSGTVTTSDPVSIVVSS
jgi:hypothetical protein